ncbi:uncharacterized protein [Channa argus]|uniref:uncharacterized protein isoform X1 n=1 Tax=Channa argus TaxID=215402 RepID=UPI003520FD94
MSVGEEFSAEDVSRIYQKVFHVPSNTDEAQTAMKKFQISGGDKNWACVGENVFDVLLEMEREREKKEQLYWDLQLLNAGNLNTLHVMDTPVMIDRDVQSCLDQSMNPKTYHQSDSGASQSYTIDTGRFKVLYVLYNVSNFLQKLCTSKFAASFTCHAQRRSLVANNVTGVMRLKKAARQCWARLVSEGVQSTLPTSWQGKSVRVQGQSFGCVSLSDVLLLLEVKYDVVTHLLYTEMLQEHHTHCVWGTFLPWQQHKEYEGLEDLAEEVLVSGDLLHLAELPGAFRVYRSRVRAYFRGHLESREKSWSAISLLCELQTSCQQERDTLTVLGKRLDRDSMRLLCLYIRLATLRAQREKLSYSALLAARQSWETWPHVRSPCRAEQAVLWLQGEEEEQKEDFKFVSPQQQSVIQLLVLTQEQERKDLVKLIHGVSLEDLQVPECAVPPQEESNMQSALRNGCIKRLRQIHATLQTSNGPPLEQGNPHMQLQSKAQPQMQAHMRSKPAMWSQHQLEDCALLLLSHLLELQEVQASALLPELMDKSAQHILQDKYESELQAPSYINLLQLLMSDDPLTSDSVFAPCENVTKNSCTDKMTSQSSWTAPTEAQNSRDGPGKALTVGSVRVQVADSTGKQEVCIGCGAVMEELPYLEILCVSDQTSETHQKIAAESRAQDEGEGSTTAPQNYEKQGSLITLAWSKPPHNDTNYDTEPADEGTEQSQDLQSSVKFQADSCEISSMVEQYDETSRESHNEESGFKGLHETQSSNQQCNTKAKMTLEERHMIDQTHGEAISECDLQTQALVTDTLQELKPYANDFCRALASEETDVSEDGVDVETCPTANESELFRLRVLESSHPDDQECNLKAKPECDFAEVEAMREPMLMDREQVREPVSAMERERTMRNLVDMQRKVEQRQQRDRERQLLRVQGRLSIIQNRKAEEDLLGLKHTERLKHLTQDLPQDDKNQQKTVVRERLEQLRRERSYVMQSKRDRNTSGFKELLGPVALHSSETDGSD